VKLFGTANVQKKPHEFHKSSSTLPDCRKFQKAYETALLHRNITTVLADLLPIKFAALGIDLTELLHKNNLLFISADLRS